MMNDILTIDTGADNVSVVYRVSWLRVYVPFSLDFALRQRAIDYYLKHRTDTGVTCMCVDEVITINLR